MPSGHRDWATKQQGYFSNLSKSQATSGPTGDIVYTIPAGRTLYITSWYVALFNADVAPYWIFLSLYNSLAVLQGVLLSIPAWNDSTNAIAQTLNMPFEIPEGYYIEVRTETASVYGYGGFTGYEIYS